MDPRGVMELLDRLTSVYTAPYQEHRIAELISVIAEENGLFLRRDRVGNMLVTLPGAEPDPPRLIFSAHMDHPALEVVGVKEFPQGAELEASPMGGFPVDVLTGGEELLLFSPGGGQGDPFQVEVASVKAGGERNKAAVFLRYGGDDCERWRRFIQGGTPVGWWAVPDFPPGVEELGDGELAMGAADDLAGCAVILATLISLAQAGATVSVGGLFTRAEEVGLVGAMVAAGEGFIPDHSSVVVVETSKPVNGTKMGLGPIIRVGDKQSVFHGGMTGLMVKLAEDLVREGGDFQYQRALLDGGRCEGTVFRLFDIPTGAISLPLHGYHNRDLENKQVVRESVHRFDMACTVELLVRLGLEFEGAVPSWEAHLEKERDSMLGQAAALLARLESNPL